MSYLPTPSYSKIEIIIVPQSSVKYFDQHKIYDDALTQHPTKHSSEEVMQQSCHNCAADL